MNNEIKYIMPNFLCLGRNEILISIYEKFKCVTRENTSIYSFYGSFPKAIWNGGRADLTEDKSSYKFMKKVKKFYDKKGITITFTFTNPLIKEEHLNDEYCNKILEIFHNGKNEVLVVSPVLEKYIREKYPKYKINKSITFADKQNPYDTDRYHLSVIDKHLNHKIDILKEIKEKEKIEILCDEVCVNNCKYTKQHYTEIGHVQLGYMPTDPQYSNCRYFNKMPTYNHIARRNKNSIYYISPEDIQNIYAPMGFKYFKLSGREKWNFIGLESIINYCIKPEYQMDVRTYILERMLLEAEKEFDYYLKTDPRYSEAIDNSNWQYI